MARLSFLSSMTCNCWIFCNVQSIQKLQNNHCLTHTHTHTISACTCVCVCVHAVLYVHFQMVCGRNIMWNILQKLNNPEIIWHATYKTIIQNNSQRFISQCLWHTHAHTHTQTHAYTCPCTCANKDTKDTENRSNLLNLSTPHTITTAIKPAGAHTHAHTPNKGPFCGVSLMTSTPCSILGGDYSWCIIIVISTVLNY